MYDSATPLADHLKPLLGLGPASCMPKLCIWRFYFLIQPTPLRLSHPCCSRLGAMCLTLPVCAWKFFFVSSLPTLVGLLPTLQVTAGHGQPLATSFDFAVYCECWCCHHVELLLALPVPYGSTVGFVSIGLVLPFPHRVAQLGVHAGCVQCAWTVATGQAGPITHTGASCNRCNKLPADLRQARCS